MAAMHARNPYRAGNPVGDSPAFVGRADVLRAVLRVLRHEQQNAIVLHGQRRIGKTSILQHLGARLPEQGAYCPIYFDLQDKAAWPLNRVLRDLGRTIAHALHQPEPDLSPDPETTFRSEWLPAILNSLPDACSLVLLFDEFDVLADPKAEQAEMALFPYLRGLLTSAPEQLQFVFVIGRNVDDLSSIALALFKSIPYERVSLLSQEDTAELVRLSESNDTMHWADEAVNEVCQLTDGHPFLTQQLCLHVWDRAYDEEPDEPPEVGASDVALAVPEVLDTSLNSMEWLWDGLPPAERIVASALAEASHGPITHEELERVLRESGVRVVIRELQNAPQLLKDWDLIEPVEGRYRFRVELLRRWIAERHPLHRVQKELDYIEPEADKLYQVALDEYRRGEVDQAAEDLRRAIDLNPNHTRANQLLADILLSQGRAGEAQQLLERLYEYQPAAARSRLVRALLAQAQAVEDSSKQFDLYEQVLMLDLSQLEVAAWLIEFLEQEGRFQDALDWTRKLADQYPGERDWTSVLKRLQPKVRLPNLYEHGVGALQRGDRHVAQRLLAQVVSLEPEYEDALRWLYKAVHGADPTKVWQIVWRDFINRMQTAGQWRTVLLVSIVVVLLATVGSGIWTLTQRDSLPRFEDITFVVSSGDGMPASIQAGGRFTTTVSEVVNITFELDSMEVEKGLSFRWDTASKSGRIPEELLDYRFTSYTAPDSPEYDAVSLTFVDDQTGERLAASFSIVVVPKTQESPTR